MCLKKLMGSPVYNVDIIFVKSRAELMDKSTSAISPIKYNVPCPLTLTIISLYIMLM